VEWCLGRAVEQLVNHSHVQATIQSTAAAMAPSPAHLPRPAMSANFGPL